ncbi:MAG: Uma2 family endonuclease [Acidobacteria bacterium]|nr:Uma2 family endonuclease [Acidobacteriota bacterium]
MDDYRIPDLTFVAAGREHVLQDDGVRGEGPDAVIEIRSPDDETYEKLPFFAALGVKEVIVCQRDSKEVEIFRLAGSQYVALQRDGEGWLASTSMGIRLRQLDGRPPRLRVEDRSEGAAHVDI